ncbi:MAG: 1-acyl-sn-glycerol-3-phosphate acyltransferase [Spirochaetales bacterium]|nr:1-acyl-sn-glycerol-3-phosphate acyltransferase [Spirochaetales bacterium]
MEIVSKKPLFIRLAKPTYGRFILWRHRITAEGMDKLSDLKPPFIVVANHVHTLDPFFISSASPVHIRWVAGAYLFRLFGLRPLLQRWVGAISKVQNKSDMHTIRMIGAALKSGDIVGLFPEGTRTWDGEPVGFDSALAKLLRLFKVPVVVLSLEGLYAERPRWAKVARKGPSTLRWVTTIDVDTIASLSDQQLYKRLKETLGFSFTKWQAEHQIPFVSKRGAEGAEQVLYLCPDCKSIGTIQTEARTIACNHCSMKMHLDEFERLHLLDGENPHSDIASWHAWERSYIANHADQLTFPLDRGVLFQRIDQYKMIPISMNFTLSIEEEAMIIRPQQGEPTLLPFADITSMAINARNTLELSCNGVRYRIRIQQNGSVLKYTEYAQAREERIKGGNS